MIRDLLESQTYAINRMKEKARARALRLTMEKLREVKREIAALDFDSWNFAERQAVMVQLQAAVSQLARGQVDLLQEGLGATSRVSARQASIWLHNLDRQYLGAVRPLRFDAAEWVATQADQISKARLNVYRSSFRRYGATAIDAIEDEIAKTIMAGENWIKARRRVWHTVRDVVGEKQWMVDRITNTETSAAYNSMQLNALLSEDKEDDPMLKRLVATFDARTGFDSIGLHGQTVPVNKPFVDPYFGKEYMAPPNRPRDREVVVGWRASYGDDLDFDDDGYMATARQPAKTKAKTPPGYDEKNPTTLIGTRQAIVNSELRKYEKILRGARSSKSPIPLEVGDMTQKIKALKREKEELATLKKMLNEKSKKVNNPASQKMARKMAKKSKNATREALKMTSKRSTALTAAAVATGIMVPYAIATPAEKKQIEQAEGMIRVRKALKNAPVKLVAVEDMTRAELAETAAREFRKAKKADKEALDLVPGDVFALKSGDVAQAKGYPIRGWIKLKPVAHPVRWAQVNEIKGAPKAVRYVVEAPKDSRILKMKK